MKRDTMVREMIQDGSHDFRVHLIHISEDHKKGGFYRQTRALSGMIDRSLDRWCDYWNKCKSEDFNTMVIFDRWTKANSNVLAYSRNKHIEKEGLDSANIYYPEYETIEHESVWDFFYYIGYDYKNKKVSNTDTLIHIEKRNK